MSTINIENAKQIREPFEIHCGIAAHSDIDLAFTASGDIAASDSNMSAAVDNELWAMRGLADFQGEGFPLDGSRELLDTSVAGSLADGKIGLRSDIGGEMTVAVTGEEEIVALTVEIASGSGTITANGISYAANQLVVIPLEAQSATLTIESDDPTRRIEVASIIPGIDLEFTNEDLVSVELDLRSDLSIISPSWTISSITIQAYYPADLSAVIPNVGDDVPIWYYAGYQGDFSPVRYFYLKEPASQLNGVLTFAGEDASGRLEDAKSVSIQRLDTDATVGRQNLYNWFVNIIEGAGIKPNSIEAAPSGSGSTQTERSVVMLEASPREHVAAVMNLAHSGTFWPVFVDAGIPSIRWTKPTSKWDIYEADCGDVQRNIARNVAKLETNESSEYGVVNETVKATSWSTLEADMTITKGVSITKNFDEWFWAYSVSYKQNDSFIWSLLNSVQWIPSATSVQKKVRTGTKKGKAVYTNKWFYRPTLYGKRLTYNVTAKSITPNVRRSGYTAEVTPLGIGSIYQGTTLIYPNYPSLFAVSNITGSFKWKGDPRMQPRDVFTFHRLDGTTELCTIESIQLTHEGGGTTADISYRKGVV